MYPVNFLPFVGSSYGTNNIFGKKIGVLGESHYGTHPSPEITREVMSQFLDQTIEYEGWMNTFKKFERSLVNKETDRKESNEIWNSLMFYNYVQELMDDPRVAPTRQQYTDSENAFFEVLEEYKPELLIVWGKRLWNNLPETGWEDGEEVIIDGYKVPNGYYKLNNGHTVQVIDVYHPSAGYDWSYWYKVISHFIGTKEEKTYAISQVGFKNFRKFTEFPTLDLGGINIIVGKNNAGKSTFDKGTVIYLDFLKQWITGSAFSLNFNSKSCRRLGINSYDEAFSYYADDNDDLVFNMTIGRYNYETAFMRTDDEYTAGVKYIKVTDLKDNNSTYTFNYEFSQTKVEATATLPVFSPSAQCLSIVENFVNSPLCQISDEEKERVFSYIDVIRKDITNTDFSSQNSVQAFELIEDILGDDVPENFDVVKMLHEAIACITKEECVKTSILLPRNASIKDFISKLKAINETQSSYDESFSNNIYSRNIEHIGLFSYSQRKVFSIYDVDDSSESLAKAVIEYCRSKKTPEYTDFIEKWLIEFNIGTGIKTEELCNEVYSIFINADDKHAASLTTLGSGAIHMVALLLRIVTTISKNGLGRSTIITIEEPEINFHPDHQCKLADFFLDVYKTFGCQIIIETHSEYLVRRIQVLVGRKKYHSEKEIEEFFPFKVFFLNTENEEEPYYEMGFEIPGSFKRKFSSEFYSIAADLDIEIIRNEANYNTLDAQ